MTLEQMEAEASTLRATLAYKKFPDRDTGVAMDLAESAIAEARKYREAMKVIAALGDGSHIKINEVHVPAWCPFCIARAALTTDAPTEDP